MAMYPVTLVFAGAVEQALRPTALVEAVASSPAAAQAVGRAVGQVLAPAGMRPEAARARVGTASQAWEGSYLYAFGAWRQVPALAVPGRLDREGGAQLAATLRGCAGAGAGDVLVDASLLGYLDGEGAAQIVESLGRMRLHLFRPGDAMRKIIGLVGLERSASLHAGLNEALAALLLRRRGS
jgi:anti-anti-sigma regulatory factor